MASKKIVQQPAAQLSSGYPELLESLKARIRQTQVGAALSVNRELALLYWHIGREILQRQEREGWGANIGVATHRLTEALPAEMQESLQSIEELKKDLGYGG
mgnify:CR=1 FL=1